MKNRVAYSKGHREQAKREKKGLVTVSWVDADGSSVTFQGIASPTQLKFTNSVIKKLIGMKK